MSNEESAPVAFEPLKKYLGMRVRIFLTEDGEVEGILRGYDKHLNVTIGDGELITSTQKIKFGDFVLRGAAIIAITEM